MAEVVQRICGSLEVAHDLLARAADLYLAGSSDRDHKVIEDLGRAMDALVSAREALRSRKALATGPAG